MKPEELLKQLNDEWKGQLSEIEKRFTVKDLEKAVERAFDVSLSRMKEMREDSFQEYSNAALRNIPYQERVKLVDHVKLEWLDSEEKRIGLLRKNYIVKPFSYWLKQGDYELLKSWGLYRFVEVFLEEAIYIKK